jgi:3-oxoacyl-[acyl-carrier-protein] synthase II
VRRVAITGMGVLTPLGAGVAELFASLVAGRSGIRRLKQPVFEALRSPIGAEVDFDGGAHFETAKLRMLDRVSQLALIAAAQAVADARLDLGSADLDRCGVCVGTGSGGAATSDEGYHTIYAERSDRVKPYTVLASMHNAPASWVGIEYGLRGPNLTFSTACSSSAVAIGEAARRIAYGEVDLMLAGGAEAPLCYGVLRAWEAMRTTASVDTRDPGASCRPFSAQRTGLVLGEGSAFLVLEEWQRAEARGAPIHAEFRGYGLTTDATHITRPSVAGQAAAMRAALRSARLDGRAIGYVNAHGTATLQNDPIETQALKEVFGSHCAELPVSSTKSMHGHLLGAAGALEFVIAVGSLERRILPPTMHLDDPDPACDLDYVAGRARSGVPLRAVMSNSFAFGGTNAVLIASIPDRKAI